MLAKILDAYDRHGLLEAINNITWLISRTILSKAVLNLSCPLKGL
jgi:hypothetical protein